MLEDESRMKTSFTLIALLGFVLATGYVFALHAVKNSAPSNDFRKIEGEFVASQEAKQ